MLINGVRDFMMKSKVTRPGVSLKRMAVKGSLHLIELLLKLISLSAERSQIANLYTNKAIK